jgi:hypothetical protein
MTNRLGWVIPTVHIELSVGFYLPGPGIGGQFPRIGSDFYSLRATLVI